MCLRACRDYVLKFNCSTPLLAAANSTVYSHNFTVAIGPTVKLEVLTQPGGAVGGVQFASQPVVALMVSRATIMRTRIRITPAMAAFTLKRRHL
jgi:hypothetical protein